MKKSTMFVSALIALGLVAGGATTAYVMTENHKLEVQQKMAEDQKAAFEDAQAKSESTQAKLETSVSSEATDTKQLDGSVADLQAQNQEVAHDDEWLKQNSESAEAQALRDQEAREGAANYQASQDAAAHAGTPDTKAANPNTKF